MYIYFVQGQITRLVKIGQTDDPKSRIASIRTNSPDKIKLLKLVKADKGDEKVIHKQFASVHSHGEWFYPSRGLMEYIDNLKKARIPHKTKAQKRSKQNKRKAYHKAKRQHQRETKREAKRQHEETQARQVHEMSMNGMMLTRMAKKLDISVYKVKKYLNQLDN